MRRETLVLCLAHQLEKRIPESIDVQEGDRLFLQAQPIARQDVEDFFQRADTARENQEAIGFRDQDVLARRHGRHDPGLGLFEQAFAGNHEFGNHPEHGAAGIQRRHR